MHHGATVIRGNRALIKNTYLAVWLGRAEELTRLLKELVAAAARYTTPSKPVRQPASATPGGGRQNAGVTGARGLHNVRR